MKRVYIQTFRTDNKPGMGRNLYPKLKINIIL